MSQPLTIACLQTRPMGTFDEALNEALTLARQGVDAGGQLLALPEYCGGLATKDGAYTIPAAPEATHPVVAGLTAFAAEAGVEMLIGSVAVEAAGGKRVNRSFFVNTSGEITARYDKIHLFDVDLGNGESYRESDAVVPGDRAVQAQTRAGAMGMSVCYDLRFPALYRHHAQAGAGMLAVPAAFAVTTGQAHWHILNRARAIENGAFVIAPCAVGAIPGGGASYGHSLIIDPWGEVLADAGAAPGVITAQIDLDLVHATRARVPSLSHDRDFTAPAPVRDVA
ncbi:MAG: carbon-nitrogen hydrolase family protein [Pseudomonadota bacterium]